MNKNVNWHFRNIDLYPSSRTARLDLALFANPTAEYRGAPFWSWNARLDPTQLCQQIECFKEMGFGGAHMHARTGLATEYLGGDFMHAIRTCTEKFKSEKMLAWLYDEDRWSSGFAGGLVTRDRSLRMKHLLWTCTPYGANGPESAGTLASRRDRTGTGTLLARYEVFLKDGCLAGYRRLGENDQPSVGGRVWYAYLETMQDISWYNNQAYVDTLNPAAIAKFVEVTHESYCNAVGQYFGTVIPTIFADEPCLMRRLPLRHPEDDRDAVVPFTSDLLETYARSYGQRLEDHLPELFWELPGDKASVARYRFHDHISERFAAAFADTCGRWCVDHGIGLTGHVLGEETLRTQTSFVGEAMRAYRAFQVPGIDVLCDHREYATAKQAQSACHQYGRPGVMSELYGVTNWDFDFTGHKGQGDWQAALGVTLRVPHLAWLSMAGEAKRDFPASIDYHSPWYKEYALIENHFSRVNVAMTRGKPLVRVGVIHPIESYWLALGPIAQSQSERDEREQAFASLIEWLLFGLIDFDFICESLLPELAEQSSGTEGFGVGCMAYDVVIVPHLRTIRATTMDRLEGFARSGGEVIFAGGIPSLVDAIPSPRPRELAARCRRVDLTRRQVVGAVEQWREVEIHLADGSPADSILHQIRDDGGTRYVFFCNTDREKPRHGTRIAIRGDWHLTLLDTLTGTTRPLASRRQDSFTVVEWDFEATGSLLLSLERGWKPTGEGPTDSKWVEQTRLSDPVPVTLSEPNVLLLDQAEWKIADQPWQPVEEVLRLANLVREKLNLPPIGGNTAQPWTDSSPAPVLAQVSLKFRIESEVDVAAPLLAIEEAASTQVTVDGVDIPVAADGWWVDEAIQIVPLPKLATGKHEIVLSIALTRKTNLEWAYLLGKFGVKVSGRRAIISAPVRELAFGDWVHQGLPFYAGNVIYHCRIEGQGDQAMAVEVPRFRNPLLSVELDNRPTGKIAFAPFRVELGRLSQGLHRLDITAYGNRVNAFGAVHNANEKEIWHGPNAWRKTGAEWAYEYQLKRMGILTAPLVKTRASARSPATTEDA